LPIPEKQTLAEMNEAGTWGVRITDAEFQRLFDEIVTPDAFTVATLLRGLMQQLFPAPEGEGA